MPPIVTHSWAGRTIGCGRGEPAGVELETPQEREVSWALLPEGYRDRGPGVR